MRPVSAHSRARLSLGDWTDALTSPFRSSSTPSPYASLLEAAFLQVLANMVGSEKRASDLLAHASIGPALAEVRSRAKNGLVLPTPQGGWQIAPANSGIFPMVRFEIRKVLLAHKVSMSPPPAMVDVVVSTLLSLFLSPAEVQSVFQAPSLGPLLDNLTRATTAALPRITAFDDNRGWFVADDGRSDLVSLKTFFGQQLSAAGLLPPLASIAPSSPVSAIPTAPMFAATQFFVDPTRITPSMVTQPPPPQPPPPSVVPFVSPTFSRPTGIRQPPPPPPPSQPILVPGDEIAEEGSSSVTPPIEDILGEEFGAGGVESAEALLAAEQEARRKQFEEEMMKNAPLYLPRDLQERMAADRLRQFEEEQARQAASSSFAPPLAPAPAPASSVLPWLLLGGGGLAAAYLLLKA